MSECYVCGLSEHEPTDLHEYWSVEDAAKEFAAMPDGELPSMTAAETLDPREAVTGGTIAAVTGGTVSVIAQYRHVSI